MSLMVVLAATAKSLLTEAGVLLAIDVWVSADM
jgi:hypothetical protein